MENGNVNHEGDKCTFQILFTSDVHGAFRNFSYASMQKSQTTGINKLSTLLKEEKRLFSGKTFILDIGDIIQGNATGVLLDNPKFRPFPLLKAYEKIGYDLVALGNHEFNFGVDTMKKAFQGSGLKRLCANVFHINTDSDGNEILLLLDGCKAYHIETLENGLRIAFIGVVSPNIVNWDKRVMEEAGCVALNAAEITKHIMNEIRDKADVFVLMGHMDTGNELGTSGSGAEDVVKENGDLTAFLGAHFHKIKGTKQEQVILNDRVKFVENLNSAGSYGKVLITATFENGKWVVKNKVGSYEESDVKTDVISLSDMLDENGKSTVKNDKKINKITKSAHKFLKKYMETTKVGELENGPLVPETEIWGMHRIVLEPTPYLAFMGQIMTQYAKSDLATVSINSYDINCQNGIVYMKDIAGICVYEVTMLMKVKLSGKQIKKWLEWSYNFFGNIDNPSGPAVNTETDLTIPYGMKKQYLHDQFWGIEYDVDLTKPVGERINIKGLSDGRAFEEDKEYTIATSSYRVTTNLPDTSVNGILNGEKFEIMDITDDNGSVMEITFMDMIEDYFRKAKDGKVIAQECKNWRFINLNWSEAERQKAITILNDNTLREKLNLTKDFFNRPITIEQIKDIEIPNEKS